MSAVAAAVVVAGVGGALIASNSASNAADKQSAAAQQATQLQYDMYNQQRKDNQAYRDAGYSALSGMQNPDFQRDFNITDFQKDPGYDFRMQQGQQAIERSAAARGGLQNGGTLKALSEYGQNYASNEYGNAYNRFNNDRDRKFGRLAQMAGMGLNAANMTGQAGQNYANQAGQNSIGASSVQGASEIAKGNAWSGALSGIGSGVAMYSGANQGSGKNWMQTNQSSINGGMFGGTGGGYGNLSGMNYNKNIFE